MNIYQVIRNNEKIEQDDLINLDQKELLDIATCALFYENKEVIKTIIEINPFLITEIKKLFLCKIGYCDWFEEEFPELDMGSELGTI